MKKILFVIIMIVGLGIGFVGIPSIAGSSFDAVASKLQSGDEKAVTQKIQEIAEMNVVEYDYTNAVNLDDDAKLKKKLSLPFTSKEVVMTYDGIMKIGADMSQIEVNVDKSDNGNVNSVTITIPELEITSNEIDRDSMSFPVEKGSLINKITTEDYDELEKKAYSEIEKFVKKSGTLENARTEMEEVLTGYVKGLFGEDVEVYFE